MPGAPHMAKFDSEEVDLLGVLIQDLTNQIGSFEDLYSSNISKDMNKIGLLLCHSNIGLRPAILS